MPCMHASVSPMSSLVLMVLSFWKDRVYLSIYVPIALFGGELLQKLAVGCKNSLILTNIAAWS